MRKGRGVGYLGKEVQCSNFRVWESKPTREMQRAVLRAHWRFMTINSVTTASTVIFGVSSWTEPGFFQAGGTRYKEVRSIYKGVI